MNRTRARVCILMLSFFLSSANAAGQAPTKPAPKTPAKTMPKSPLDDAMRAMFSLHEFQQAVISPDGTQLAWVESFFGPGGAPSGNSAIYMAKLSTPEAAKRISAGDGKAAHEEHDIAWSPDSKQLAFLSDAAKHGQLDLYVVSANQEIGVPRGEEHAKRPGLAKARTRPAAESSAKRLTKLTGFLASPGWSPDGKTIALLFTENATRAAGPLVAETPDEGVVSDAYFEQRLTLVDAATSRTRQISAADMYVYEFDWAPDSRRLVVTAAHGNGDDNWYIASLLTIEAESGDMHALVDKPGMQIAVPKWSPDGKTIALIGGLMSDEPIPGGDVYTVPSIGGAVRNITPGMKMSATALDWMPDSSAITVTGIKDGQSFMGRVKSGEEISPIWAGAETIAPGPFVPYVSLARDGKRSAVVRQSFAQPPEVWAGAVGDWKQITHRNAELKAAWGEAKSLHWKTSIGDVQGWLIYPRDFDPSKKYPLVVRVHGGPAWAVTPEWPTRWDYAMALPSQGYFVLEPNPRGSYGQGEKFTRANVKDFGGGDFLDIMAGVDQAIKSAPIDANRLGITGWSYGGYMTMWGVTQTNRFRAAVSGAGLSDWLSYTGENKIDQWMIPYFGATVYDDPVVYAKSEPMKYIKQAKTPTLVVVGDSDGECPPPQSYEFWHALKTLGVPTEFVIYPKEGHLFADPAHSRDVIERATEWFDKYLAPTR
jgi:dipeptidyl aminopeptidase/acylaminoacyl peptidase